jgi:hypothetical protein
MSTSDGLAREPFEHQPRPRTLEGDVDLDYDDTRRHHHAALTDAGLTSRFRRRFPRARAAECDAMVRALGYVWGLHLRRHGQRHRLQLRDLRPQPRRGRPLTRSAAGSSILNLTNGSAI